MSKFKLSAIFTVVVPFCGILAIFVILGPFNQFCFFAPSHFGVICRLARPFGTLKAELQRAAVDAGQVSF